MKKLIAIILAAMMIFALVSCAGKSDDAGKNNDTPKNTEEATEPATEPATEEATEPVSTEPIEPLVDAFLDEYECVTHGKVDIMFNYAGDSFTMENLAAIIKEAAGLDGSVTVEIDEDVFAELKENYQDSGDGGGAAGNGFVWPDPVTVTFTNPATEEVVEREISFSFRKCLPSVEIYPNGVLGTCPEDSDATMKMAYTKLIPYTISAEAPNYEGYEGEYTEEAVKAFFREVTGLTDEDAYDLTLVNFDPETRGEAFYVVFSFKNAPEGKFDPVWIETAF